MEGTRGDKEDVIGHDRAMFRVNGTALYDGEQVSLNTFSGYVGSTGTLATSDFVDLVEKDDPGLFHLVDRFTRGVVHIDQLLGFFLRQVFQRLGHLHESLLLLTLEHPTEHVTEIVFEVIQATHVGDDADRKATFFNIHLDRSFIQLAFPQFEPQLRPRGLMRIRRGLNGCLARAFHKSRSRGRWRQEEVK